MANKSFVNVEEAREAGKKSSRKGIPNRSTEIYNAMVKRQLERQEAGQKPLTLEDLRQDNYEGLLILREDAKTWQEKFLIEQLIAKLLHTVKVEHTGKDGTPLISNVIVEVCERKKDDD